MENKLTEQENNIDSMICASILQELIFSVENALINDARHETSKLDTNLNDSFLNCIDSGIDCEEFEDNWCNIVMNSDNDDHIYFIDLKSKDFKQLMLISNAINEIRYKNFLIKNIQNNYIQCKKQFYLLHNRFIEQSLKIMEYFLNILNQLDDEQPIDLPIIIQKMINDISQNIDDFIQLDGDII